MNTDEIFDNRRAISKKICKAIRDNGEQLCFLTEFYNAKDILDKDSKELRGDDLRNLEYSKSTRHYEDEANWDTTIDDLDKELLHEYKLRIGAEYLSDEQVLKARGFIKNVDDKERLR